MWTYPNIKKLNLEEVIHGEKINDPYRWLEDPDSEETVGFVNDQITTTQSYLDKSPNKKTLTDMFTKAWNFEKYSGLVRFGDRFIYSYNSGLLDQSIIYVLDSLEAEPRVLIDANKLSKDGTTSIRNYSISPNNEIFGYTLSESDSDWVSVRFKSIKDSSDYGDVLTQVKFSDITWTKNNDGVFYSWYEKTGLKADGTETDSNENQKIRYHKLGTDQSEDPICFENPKNPKWMTMLRRSSDHKYLLVMEAIGCDPNHTLSYVNLEEINHTITGPLNAKKIVDNFDAFYDYISNDEKEFTFITNHSAPEKKLVSFNIDKPDPGSWTTVIKANKEEILEDAIAFDNDKIAVVILRDVVSYLTIRSLKDGTILQNINLECGSISYLISKRDYDTFTFNYTSMLQPSTCYIYSCKTKKAVKFKEPNVEFLNLSEFEVRQEFCLSKDNTRIPYFLIRQIGLENEVTPRPCELYGYGGFNISLSPAFSIYRLMYVKYFKGVYVVANIRGGSEYGLDWYHKGRREFKQNCFDDFQSVAEHLIKKSYTKPSLLNIRGGSNGGLLVSVCANQRPDLFNAVVCEVPVTDLVRFHKFTIGHAWISDFGNPDVKEDFQSLIKYSSLHNIKMPDEGQYPAILVLTADHDDRVVPLHSFKYIATLQNTLGPEQRQKKPFLCRIEKNAGHGGTVPTSKQITRVVDIFLFLELSLNTKDI